MAHPIVGESHCDHAHSLQLVRIAVRAMKVVTATDVIRVLHKAAENYGYPAAFLTDNGLIFTGHRRYGLAGATEHELFALGIEARHSRPHHPQTCGKVERFHQTMKKFLAKQEGIETKKQLQRELDRFVVYYNEVRPHRGIGRRTPASVYGAREKAQSDGGGGGHRRPPASVRQDRQDRCGDGALQGAAPSHRRGAPPTRVGTSPCSSTTGTSRSWGSTAPRSDASCSILPRTTNLSRDKGGLQCLDTSVS